MDIFTIFDQKIVLTVLGTSALIQVIILTKRLLNCKSQEQYKNGYKMRVEYLFVGPCLVPLCHVTTHVSI